MNILITGPESSGKTSLAQSIHEAFQMPVIEDYSRIYLAQHGPSYEEEEIAIMAKAHETLVQQHNATDLILDSYLLNYKIWSEYKYLRCDPEILSSLQVFNPDITLLCRPDLPWEYDPLRESPLARDELFCLFRLEIENREWPYHIISGIGDERTESAKKFIDERIR